MRRLAPSPARIPSHIKCQNTITPHPTSTTPPATPNSNQTVGIGEDIYFPVPGLNIGIDHLSAGVYGVATVEGNESVLQLDLGVDACLSIAGKQECGAKVGERAGGWWLVAGGWCWWLVAGG